ncbi:hypothetical protein AB0E63_29770 [Kribbella sp. NPDC026596]|jgi:hypothetical protein|uniref:hypothetical protein n=1 Tax=Kribbella sp. NPDC026596 TaxID=3155122 RepID=UPI0033FD6DCD
MDSQFLDRLATSERLESWQPGDLAAALEVVERLDAARQGPDGSLRALDIRLAICRQRLQFELDRRAAETG